MDLPLFTMSEHTRYSVIEKLGSGSIGTTYKAIAGLAGQTKTMAVKLVHAELVFDEAAKDFVYKIGQDAISAIRYNPPFSWEKCSFWGNSGIKPHGVFISTEFIDALNLRELLSKKGKFSIKEVAGIVEKVFNILSYYYVNYSNKPHCGIKPTNIFVSKLGEPDEEVNVTDLWLNQIVTKYIDLKTEKIFGITSYLAPEQLLNKAVDTRTDVYSLAMTCYEMLTGQLPFSGTPLEIAQQQVKEQVPPIRTFEPEMPRTIELIFLRALARNPEDRYQSLKDFAKALKNNSTYTPRTLVDSDFKEKAGFNKPNIEVNLIDQKVKEIANSSQTQEEKVVDLEKVAEMTLQKGMFVFGTHNELRHWYGGIGHERFSIAQCDLILMILQSQDYIMNILSSWELGKDNQKAISSYLDWVRKYPDLIYMKAACWLKVGNLLEKENLLVEAKSYYEQVLKISGLQYKTYPDEANRCLENLKAQKMPSEQTQTCISKVFDNYIAKELIGSNKIGATYKGKHLKKDQEVTIKVINKDFFPALIDLESLLDFNSKLESLNPPRALLALNAGIDAEDQLFIIREYIPLTLENMLKKEEKIPVKTIVSIIVQVCDLLEKLSEKGLSHSNLKASNILISFKDSPDQEDIYKGHGREQVRVTDFCSSLPLAKFLDNYEGLEENSNYQENSLQRSDIFSLAVVLYQCLTHNLSYDKKFFAKLFSAKESLSPPSKENPNHVPFELDEVALKALSLDPQYKSAKEFSDDLRTALAVSQRRAHNFIQIKENTLSLLTRCPNCTTRQGRLPASIRWNRGCCSCKKDLTNSLMVSTKSGMCLGGNYYFEELIGKGFLGEIYSAEYNAGGSTFIKILNDFVGNTIVNDHAYYNKLCRIGHPNLIPFSISSSRFGVYAPNNVCFNQLELLNLFSLKDFQDADVTFLVDRALGLFAQVCRAVEFLHRQRDIIHGNIKPSNILIENYGSLEEQALVTDYGFLPLYKDFNEILPLLPKANLEYMSPEQIVGGKIEKSSDTYSLGVLLYHMLTGKVPFVADSLDGYIGKHLEEKPIPPRKINPDIPDWLEGVVLHALAKDPKERLTAKEFLLSIN